MRHVAIIGAGYSGTLLAVQMADAGWRVSLVERAPVPGLGAAYSTTERAHLLNVCANNMGAFADDAAGFAHWLSAQAVADAHADDMYAPRADYGRYLRSVLDDAQGRAGERLRIVTGAAVDVAEAAAGMTVGLTSGETIAADVVVLATGNMAPATPPGLGAVTSSPRYLGNPWGPGLTDGLVDGDTVLLVGTGLTMVDTVLTLAERGFGGTMIAVSRRGLIPRAQGDIAPYQPIDTPPSPPLSQMTRTVRRRAEQVGWRAAVNELRPFTQGLWSRASVAERARFLRHLRPWWDVHRHRIAPVVAKRIAALREDGRLQIAAGKLIDASEGAEGITVRWRERGSDDIAALSAQRIVNCTGPRMDVARSGDPLLSALIGRGAIRPDPLHIGVDVGVDCGVHDGAGNHSKRLYAIGPITRGRWWEIVAVPDIRRQVMELARRLTAGA